MFTKLLADSLRPELRVACDVAAGHILHETELRGVQVVVGVKIKQLRDEEVL